MAFAPAITGVDQLRDRLELATLLNWRAEAVQDAKLDRDELSINVERESIRGACEALRASAEAQYNFLSDITCVDWYPSEPRFEVVYHLLSIPRRARIRLKVRLNGDDPQIDSITPIWPAANFFEREVFDLFGIKFDGHPYLRRIMMPDDWSGHPLRKDYPVEGYR